MPKRLDHVAIFVEDMQKGIAFYRDMLGLPEPVRKRVPELGIECSFFDTGDDAMIELVAFSGEGELKHGDVVVAIEVDDLDAALAEYRSKGMRVFDQPATENLPFRRGWVTKKSGHGTIVELCPRGKILAYVRNQTAGIL